jgi:hypothetical protein
MSYILDNEKQIEKAVLKAKKIRTQVRFIAFGIYSVRGTKGNFYTVKCERTDDGEKRVICECLGASKGLVCWHSAAALSLHVGLARQRRTESV